MTIQAIKAYPNAGPTIVSEEREERYAKINDNKPNSTIDHSKFIHFICA